MMKPERPGDEQMIKELKEMVPITMLTEEQQQEIKKMNRLEGIRYFNQVTNEGLKMGAYYYDLYIDDRPAY